MKITRINVEDKKEKRKRRVCAYARVSTFSDEQEESYESQIAYYTEVLSNTPEFEFVGMYADRGLSGLRTENRPDFMRMIADARNKKFDLIYCKSISRFCRNSADCQRYLHELKGLEIEVRFEKEGLSSFDSQSELVFNLMSIVAQEESRSISENTTWALDRLAEKGIRRLGHRAVFGYKEVDGVLVPDENAKYVKFIFEERAKGTPVKVIAEQLKKENIIRRGGKGKSTTAKSVLLILHNVIYKGDRIIQQDPHPDYITKKPDSTKPYVSVYVKGAHEPIVSVELWEKVNFRENKSKTDLKKIRVLIADNPEITIKKMAEILGKTAYAVTAILRRQKEIKYVKSGESGRKGHWEYVGEK